MSSPSQSPPATNTSSPAPEASSPPPAAVSTPPPSSTPPPAASLHSPPAPSASSPAKSTPPSTISASPPPSSSSAVSPPPPPSSSSSTPSPPPPPRSSSSKSSSHSPSSSSHSSESSARSSSSPSSSSSGISTGVVIGIAICGVVLLLVLSIVCICCTKKRKRRKHEYGDENYYFPRPPPAPGPKDGYYGGTAQQWQQSNPPPSEPYTIPKPNPSPPAARPPLSPSLPPPPPPPFVSNSGGSVSDYSVPEGPLPPPSPGIALGFSKSTFTYEELAMATDGFSDANLLGKGGFGYVHKGILPNRKEVAVKSLKAGGGQGEREFQAEVEIISRVHHKHLVSLVGYCMAGSQRILVYEFVPNNTLEFHLHGNSQTSMDWPTRLKIALGSAKGLAYLHEDCHPKIIHRDIKAANILLDFKFEAKVADFGLAKLSSDVNTHISTRVMGTFGYLAPEYASSGKLTEKSDVFSFGIMLLELITGRRPVDTTNSYMDDSLVDWARPLLAQALEDNSFDSLVDARLRNRYNQNEMARMVACAAACVRHSARRRPRMSQTVRALEGEVSLSDLSEGIRPGQSAVYGSYGSSDYDSSQYKEEMKKFRQVAYATSEYGGTTSEYGLYPSGLGSEGQMTREMDLGTMKGESRGFSGISGTSTTGEMASEKMKRDS